MPGPGADWFFEWRRVTTADSTARALKGARIPAVVISLDEPADQWFQDCLQVCYHREPNCPVPNTSFAKANTPAESNISSPHSLGRNFNDLHALRALAPQVPLGGMAVIAGSQPQVEPMVAFLGDSSCSKEKIIACWTVFHSGSWLRRASSPPGLSPATWSWPLPEETERACVERTAARRISSAKCN